MKHVSKALWLVLVAVLAVGTFSACNRLKGLTQNEEWRGSPETVSRNKEPYSSTLVPFETAEQAIGSSYSESPYYQSLNGEWDFTLVQNPGLKPSGFESKKYAYTVSEGYAAVRRAEADPVTWGKISIPSNWEMKGYDAPTYTYNTYAWGRELVAPAISESYNPVGIYRNTVTVPADWSGRQVYITLEGVSSCVYVYVNGVLVGYAEDSYTGKTFNLTEAIEFGKENLICFEVYKYCDGSYLEANDSIKFGGIYRDVYLYSAPEVQLRDFSYDMQMSGNDALMNVTVSLASYKKHPGSDYAVDMSVYDSEGKRILEPTRIGSSAVFPENIATTANAYLCDVGSRVSVPSPALWSAETPNLYTVVLELKQGDHVVDVVSKTIGFKTVGVSLDDSGKQTFLLNGEKISIRGILYNENSPVSGMALSTEEMIADIKLMKQLNINAVRSPGRPLSAEFIRLCDEYGLYVVDDMSLNSNPYSNRDESSIPGDQSVWQNACLDRLLNIVSRDKNSASVIMWSIGNNSGTGSNFSVLRTWLTSADSRMIVYDGDDSASDLVFGSDLSLSEFVELLEDANNKKSILLQDSNGGLLNNGGNFSAYAELLDTYSNFQGGFFSYWTDNAVYWPLNSAEANQVLQETPYNDANASSYRLTYAGGYGESTSASDTYKALSGIVTADRKLQSDAVEFRNAFSPIYISVEDAAAGRFKITNRNSFTNFQDNYEISYEILNGTESVRSGKVSGLQVNPSSSATFTVDYGTVPSDAEYVIYFTVKYKTAPSWVENADAAVFAKQFNVSEMTSVRKDGTVQNHNGTDLSLEVFQVPSIYISNYSFAQGKIYVTNRSQTNLNDLFTVDWAVYEQHAYWKTKRWVEYGKGTLNNFNVPAGSVNHEITIPLRTNGGVRDGLYAGYILLTLKQDVGEVKAGTQLIYSINYDLSSNIPFIQDPARALQVINVNEATGEGELVPAEIDEEPPVDTQNDLFDLPEIPATYRGNSVISLTNDLLDLKINADTGLITRYNVSGKDIFLNNASGDTASMISNLMRNTTGGDRAYAKISTSTLNALKSLSQNYSETKILPNGYEINRISGNHYRITLNYIWVDYPIKYSRTFVSDSAYTVVYDVYSDGELQVSVKYDPAATAQIPFELSSIMTLTSDFKTMSWYGLGEGETYSDKKGDSKLGLYQNQAIVDQIGAEYLYSTGSGDKSEVRWVSFERSDGSGVLITSDTNLFGVNVSKDFPWTTTSYVTNGASAASKATILRIIGRQRGVSAGSLFDQQYSEADYIEPGVSYTYSFRVVPVSKGYDGMQISRTVLNSGTNLSAAENLNFNNATFALSNAAAPSSYLSSQAGNILLRDALGNESQYWIRENSELGTDVFSLRSSENGLYLMPTCVSGASEVEITLARFKNQPWQTWQYSDNQLFANDYSAGRKYSLYVAGSDSILSASGARISLKLARSDRQSFWTIVADENDASRVRIMNSLSGKYLTVVERISFANPIVENYAYRMRNYDPMTDWVSPMNNAPIPFRNTPNADASWAGSSDQYVTQWQLLPAESQLWNFRPVGNGYAIVNRESGNALSLVDGELKELPLTGTSNQVWSVIACDGMYGFVNAETNLALTLRSVSGNSVLTVQTWDALAVQKWNAASTESLQVQVEVGNNWYN